MWHSTGVGIRDPNKVIHLIKPRQVANIAENTAYFRTHTVKEYMGVLDFIFDNFEVFTGDYGDFVPPVDGPPPEENFLNLGFDSKWSFPWEQFNKLVKLFPEVHWCVQTQEPAMGHMSQAMYNPHDTELFEEPKIIYTKFHV